MAWTGNSGTGTAACRAYARDYSIICAGKSVIEGSTYSR